MYLIKLKFESDVNGVYTYEEETATDKELSEMKQKRMLDKWIKNLFEYMSKLDESYHEHHDHSLFLNNDTTLKKKIIIERLIVDINKWGHSQRLRTFTFDVYQSIKL